MRTIICSSKANRVYARRCKQGDEVNAFAVYVYQRRGWGEHDLQTTYGDAHWLGSRDVGPPVTKHSPEGLWKHPAAYCIRIIPK